MSTIQNAALFASRAHEGQYRHDGFTPYMVHPLAVANRLRDESDEVVMTALLHDVVEDTDFLMSDLVHGGFPTAVIDAVCALTHSSGTTYHSYLDIVKSNPIALKVKIADMLHNLSDSPSDRQIVKYAKGLLYLLDESHQ